MNMKVGCMMVVTMIAVLGGSRGFSDMQPYSGKKAPMNAAAPQDSSKAVVTMSQEEMDFSASLSDLHKMIFTKLFTPAMREQAMSFYTSRMSGMKGNKSKVMPTQDEAVEQVVKNNRGVAMGQTSSPQPGANSPGMNQPKNPQQNSMSGKSQNSTATPPQSSSNTQQKKKYYWD